MASIEELLVAKLRGAAGVAALVSTRVYWKRSPQGALLPNLVYQRISSPPRPQGMGRDVPIETARYQITARADSPTGARDLAEAVKDALEQWRDDGPPVVEHTQFAGETELDEPGRATGSEKVVDARAVDFLIKYRRD